MNKYIQSLPASNYVNKAGVTAEAHEHVLQEEYNSFCYCDVPTADDMDSDADIDMDMELEQQQPQSGNTQHRARANICMSRSHS